MKDTKRTLETLEFVGGIMCLDFANTVNSRHELEHDYLASYSDLVNWAGKATILSPKQVKNLNQRAQLEAEKANVAVEKARDVRETIYRAFSAIASRSNPKEEDLGVLTRLYEEAIGNGRLVKVDDHFEFEWEPDKTFDALLWCIVSSAEKLLSVKEIDQVKECPGCGWLFLDISKNQSRRWCSMNTCGARDKMRRYHGRLKKK